MNANQTLAFNNTTSSPTWTGTFSLTSDTNNIYLNYAAVPEPRAALIGGLRLLGGDDLHE